jgi:galactokinase
VSGDNPVERVAAAWPARYDDRPDVIWSAPGRVNLIGEHTDYNDGFVLPFALPRRTAVAAARATGPESGSESGSDSPEWTVWSESTGDPVSFTGADLVPGAVTGWAAYVAGVVWSLREAGVDVPAARIAVTSDVPLGAGLSSSAALECAVLAAMLELAGAVETVPRHRWPALAQRAENAYVGMPCGIMDQSAATLCRAAHALLLDCRSQESEQIPFALAEAGLAILVTDTRAPHRLVTGEYARRRASCEAAAAALGVPALRDVTDEADLSVLPDALSRRRARHVVTENKRVHATIALLRAGRPERIGPLLNESHASLRDDYEVTVPELDVAAEAAVAAGALGARMTGGGFGGCVISLIPIDQADDVAGAVAEAFAARGFGPPASFPASTAAGVARH